MTIWCDIDYCRNDAAWRLVSHPDNVLLCNEHRQILHPAHVRLEYPDERIEALHDARTSEDGSDG